MGYGYSVADGAETVMGYPYEDLEPYGEYASEWDARDDYEMAWEDWKEDALSCLSPAWHVTDGKEWRDGHPGGRVIARSGLHEMLLEECQGGYGYAYLSIVPRADLPEDGYGYCPATARAGRLARASLTRCATPIFDRLAKLQELSVPGGYTSSAYRAKAA
jgi:hypothetical protein